MRGFRINKSGQSLEKVDFNTTEINLLVNHPKMEIMHQLIKKDKMFYIYPGAHEEVMEFYYVLSGSVKCEDYDGEKVILTPGDYICSQGLKEPVHFKTLEEVKLLIFTNEESFYHISEKLGALEEASKMVEAKDRYTANHSQRVAEYSVGIARKMKMDTGHLKRLTRAAFLHDIGKVNVPEEILNKPGKLTNEEYEIMKKHPADGAHMVAQTYYKDLAPIIHQHHERLDGSGYPDGLKGDEILIEARIIAVSDTFDALTEDRVYRKAWTAASALEEIKAHKGDLYDETVVELFEEVLREEGKID
ncbi:HD domain-containing phosphohydrolase [Jeotgalibacillus haloalkalitolerans]|uniref:HD domain-containing protein n=1 Tax=Jeotgalibacillus haloalkalitolerans TaxID=3104292 RepID=A0ABU5KHT7_9BACL|nr:HD domain-containing phosphohydrolase [Jeotgalibacillus sp. HH7-29]MDZ5710797.1 HD domain-containing protein [Jeotgalibacillus sp. HH7-29]